MCHGLTQRSRGTLRRKARLRAPYLNVRHYMEQINESNNSSEKVALLHTPQGKVLLFYFVTHYIYALAIGVLGVAPPFGWQTVNAIIYCIIWPFILL